MGEAEAVSASESLSWVYGRCTTMDFPVVRIRTNKNRLCSKTSGGYEILATKVNYFNLSKIEQLFDQECWIPPRSEFIEPKSSKQKLVE